ncbi:MAG: hypothetical protein E6Q50_09210 [Lysobacter sp.]|nr:MAG: hypothetical protein E6Q50_09210 [Lysobacter sp.]
MPSKVDSPMHDATTPPSPSDRTGEIAPETIVKRLLEFIRATQSVREMERGRFWTALALPPQVLSDRQYFGEEEGYQSFSQEIADTRWSYTVSFSENSNDGGSRSARLSFEHPENRNQNTDIDLGSICGVDIEAFRKDMKAAGFSEMRQEPSQFEYESKGVSSFGFRRNGILVDVVAQREAAQPEAKRKHLCVLGVEVRAFSDSPADGASH